MESPPSSSTWSEAFILSDDSGLLLTNGSASSGSMSYESRNGRKTFHFEDSDCEEKSLSQDESLDGMSDVMCGENFSTLKKGPHWSDFSSKHSSSPIEPPLEFQDKPRHPAVDIFCEKLSSGILRRALFEIKESELKRMTVINQLHRPLHHLLGRPYFTSEFIQFSPCHVGRPSSRSSLGSSRLSSSHNSLSVPTTQRVDDSTFITQAVSHDTLSLNQISDLYNVPFDSDVYAVPIDVVKPPVKPKRTQQHKKRRRNTACSCREIESNWNFQHDTKRHSVAGTSAPVQGEPIHMTLQEVRQYLQTLYSSSSDSSEPHDKFYKPKTAIIVTNNNKYPLNANSLVNREMSCVTSTNRTKKNTFLINIKNKKVKDSSCDNFGKQINPSPTKKEEKRKKTPARLFSFKQTLCNMFRFRRFLSPEQIKSNEDDMHNKNLGGNILDDTHNNISSRALPPLPLKEETEDGIDEEQTLDFATNIQRVKDYGWYWGPISSEAAEKILSNEPDGSFIVRDSSDDHYIFSLTFKLNNCVRHVRIEHDQGNFSFGSCTKFKSQTIVEFIENAVEHSRSGRFVIHKNVRRDLIPNLPLPRRMIDYINTPHYYSEHFVDMEESGEEPALDTNPTPQTPRVLDNQEHDVHLNAEPNVPVNNYVQQTDINK
ncbi:hypothetical protein NQ315_000836 [Exocentrus adspersus]|uniref:SH2 domain-containing protein n=1 Tax=Exocentrus adspersus TaxID=1586481 RepID=A0AAV8WDB3_9CUCU|nr:hypothetical protein NQ315_000836 [Exocentrus adspersus]